MVNLKGVQLVNGLLKFFSQYIIISWNIKRLALGNICPTILVNFTECIACSQYTNSKGLIKMLLSYHIPKEISVTAV